MWQVSIQSEMPCAPHSHRCYQCVFVPLVFMSRVTPECVLPHSPLPWDIMYDPHVDGAIDRERYQAVEPRAQSLAAKKQRPNREPNHSALKGFDLRTELGIPDALYAEMEVCK